ncbi:type I methionyl aminopeptidase [Candidatus Saccharibacteria bacterium]|nr:type I methionyl aminopeptidase [Candidatus Saccharibacteria bacterium]
MYTRVKTDKEIAAMRVAGKICADVLKLVKNSAVPGISTKELSEIAAKEIKSLGAKASFLGYKDFPEAICISLNDEVVHGIPSKDKIIKKGDIASFDLGVTYDGMIVDSAISCLINSKDKEKLLLLEKTELSLMEGIHQIKHNCRVGDIGSAIQKILDRAKYGIVRDLVGHGVGHAVHEEPNIPNYGYGNSGPLLKKGMTVAIEPMATMGDHEVFVGSDGWTIKTRDGSLSAHYEHTVLVTDDGHEVLTISDS